MVSNKLLGNQFKLNTVKALSFSGDLLKRFLFKELKLSRKMINTMLKHIRITLYGPATLYGAATLDYIRIFLLNRLYTIQLRLFFVVIVSQSIIAQFHILEISTAYGLSPSESPADSTSFNPHSNRLQHSEPKSSSEESVNSGFSATEAEAPLDTGVHGSEIIGVFIHKGSDAEAEREVVSIDRRGRVLRTDETLKDGRELFNLDGRVTALAFLPEQSLMAIAIGSRISIFDVGSRKLLNSFGRLQGSVKSLAFNSGGLKLLAGGADGRIYRFDLQAREQTLFGLAGEAIPERYIGHASVVSAVVYHPFDPVFFSGDWQGAMSAWLEYEAEPSRLAGDRALFAGRFVSESGQRVRARRESTEGLTHLKVSADGELLLAGVQSGEIEVWQLRGFRKVVSQQASRGALYDLLLSDDGKRIASLGRDGKLIVYELRQGPGELGKRYSYRLEQRYSGNHTTTRRMAFWNDRSLILGDMDGSLSKIEFN